MIKLIIFDFGGTLNQSSANSIFPDAVDVLEYCKSRSYKMAIVSLIGPQKSITIKEREDKINNSGVSDYFNLIKVTNTDKDKSFEDTIKYFGVENNEVCIVDDRTIRGVRFGNKNGCQTVWFQNGKFANELPNEDTGNPSYIIHSLIELKDIL
jgi:FMN phosphatase YigB (HAD superfamily)